MILARRSFLAAGAGLFVASAAHADPLTSGLLVRVANARASIRSLRGTFTQTRSIAVLATRVRSSGRLTLVRPDRLRWDLDPPDDVTFWVGPEGLAYRSEHGRGSLASPSPRMTAGLEDLRTLLGGDLATLEERWILRVLRDDSDGVEIDASARSPTAGGLQGIRFALAADLVRPRAAVLRQGAADRTDIAFAAVTIDAPVDDATMRPPT